MELQIGSTLKIIANTDDDTTVQIHGLHFLVDSCNEKLNESDVCNLPIVDTVVASYNHFKDNTVVKLLCCTVLIKYSRFNCCIREASQIGIIPNVLNEIKNETDEKLLTMELGVISAYGACKCPLPIDLALDLLHILSDLYTTWHDNIEITQQLLSVYMLLSSDLRLHLQIMDTALIQDIPELISEHLETFPVIFGIISICTHLALSEEGRRFLQSIHIFTLIQPCIPLYGYDTLLCSNITRIIVEFNTYSNMASSDYNHIERTRYELLHYGGCTVLMNVLNCCQNNENTVEDVMQAVCLVCSSNYKSASILTNYNFVASIIMILTSYLQNTFIASKGIESIAWILEVSNYAILRETLDEGILHVCCDLLVKQTNLDVIHHICSLISKICVKSLYISAVLDALDKSGILTIIKNSIIQYRSNESIIVEYMNLIAVLCSNKECTQIVIHTHLIEEVILCSNCCQLPKSGMLESGILWKTALEDEGKSILLANNGIDSILKLLQQFINSIIVQRNGFGCLALLCQDDLHVCTLFRRRLGISLLFDSIEKFSLNPQYCVQVIALLQNLLIDKECYKVLLDRNVCSIILTILSSHYRTITIASMCLVFLNSFVIDDDSLYQLITEKDTKVLIEKTMQANPSNDVIHQLSDTLINKLKAFNNTL